MNIYLTSDTIGGDTGGGKVTFHESEAFKTLGSCQICSMKKEREQPKTVWDDDELAYSLLKEEKPVLVHGYAGTFSKTTKALKDNGAKVSWTIAAHDVEVSKREHEKLGQPFPYPHLTESELWKRYIAGYKEADVLIAPGKAPCETLRKQGFEQRIEIIPHGCDEAKCIKSFPSKFVLGYLGSYGIDKGVVYLLQAWKKLRYRDGSFLKLGGRDSDSAGVRSMYNLFGGGNVEFAGWQPDIGDFYNSLTCYCQPSCTEGYGIEIAEAASHARPLICSTGAGAADLVVEGVGLRFPPCDVTELAERIDWYKNNQDKAAEHGMNALEKSKEVRWDRVREMYQKVWKEMLV